MDLGLKGKRALVTGASSGIGAAIAVELAGEGVSVVVQGRDRERAEQIAKEVESKGAKSVVALGDICDDTDADAIVKTALDAFGGIDILVNCAGGVVRSDNPDWMDMSSDEWLQAFNLNVVSIIRFAQRLTPGMIERGWGRIINISSIAGGALSGVLHDYGAAKSAVDHLTMNLSKTLAPKGVTVNAVIPGMIMTPQCERWIVTLRNQNGWSDDLAENERIYTTQFSPQPVPRIGRPDEIAAAVTFLASNRSNYTTGALLRVDGGNAKGR